MTPGELALHRRNTAAFISADPISVVLVPQIEEETASGGRRWVAGEPREPQIMRMIARTDSMPEVKTAAGRVVTASYVLLAAHDAQIAQYDYFIHNGEKFELVTPIRPEHSVDSIYERKADVARL